jgi:hypothetical protein
MVRTNYQAREVFPTIRFETSDPCNIKVFSGKNGNNENGFDSNSPVEYRLETQDSPPIRASMRKAAFAFPSGTLSSLPDSGNSASIQRKAFVPQKS